MQHFEATRHVSICFRPDEIRTTLLEGTYEIAFPEHLNALSYNPFIAVSVRQLENQSMQGPQESPPANPRIHHQIRQVTAKIRRPALKSQTPNCTRSPISPSHPPGNNVYLMGSHSFVLPSVDSRTLATMHTIPSSLVLLASAVVDQSSTTTTSAAPSCTASLVTTLCDYPSPGSEFAVAEDSVNSCWAYCDSHPPCNFVIFSAGNPTMGSGTCWLYPGQSFDTNAGTAGCSALSVYDKPSCAGSATTTSGASSCTATASPSAIAEVCGYPTPPDNCFDSCTTSTGAADCLSQCAESGCSFVVFNPHNDANSQYASGTCWIYPNGTYDASAGTACTGTVEQYVYENKCPKPSSSASAAQGSITGSVTTGVGGDAGPIGTPSATGTNSESAAGIRYARAAGLAVGLPLLLLLAL